jgi:AIPR protein
MAKMNLRQQLVTDRVEGIADSLKISEDLAFLRLVHSLLVDQSVYSFDENDLVDGGQDKQIDVITIEQDTDEATIYILQAKNSDSFSSNALIQMGNGLDWIFNRSRSEIKKLSNVKLRDRILDCRSAIGGLGPSNVSVVVAFITNGLTAGLSDEFKEEIVSIQTKYDNQTFQSFDLKIWGADEIVFAINALERNLRKINEDLSIQYDKNTPSLIRYFAQGLKGVVCTVTGREIARVVLADKQGAVFDFNIRRFLGDRRAVNADILRTCSKSEDSYLFWFLNNGITIVCDRMDAVTDPDTPHIKLENMQIVNGCQTATTIAHAARDSVLAPDTRVLLRIYETNDVELVNRIVQTTNNQNRISSRDLRANDPIQVDMQKAFLKYNLFYERKLFEFSKDKSIDPSRIAPNEVVAQSYLGVVLKRPSDARRRKYKIWGELYSQIFGGSRTIEPYVIALRLFWLASKWLRESKYSNDRNELRRKLARNGAFHIARMGSYFWRDGDKWDDQDFKAEIETLEQSSDDIAPHFERAFKLFNKIFKDNSQYKLDPDGAFKTSSLDEDIDRELHRGSSRGPKTRRR